MNEFLGFIIFIRKDFLIVPKADSVLLENIFRNL